jgi:hypothetical protein
MQQEDEQIKKSSKNNPVIPEPHIFNTQTAKSNDGRYMMAKKTDARSVIF